MLFLSIVLAGCGHDHQGIASRSRGTDLCAPSVSETLVVFIHGRGDDASVFEDQGFIDELRRKGSRADFVSVQATRKLFRQRSLTRRLHEQVITPAKSRGYRRIFLVGVSRGGLGALSYAQAHPDAVDGVLVLAPFLGPSFYVEDVERQGGLRRWSPAKSKGWWTSTFYKWPPAQDIRNVWTWLQSGATAQVNLQFAWGRGDPFAPALELASEVIPDTHLATVDGGHDWTTWRTLWSDFLRRDPYHLTNIDNESIGSHAAFGPTMADTAGHVSL